MFLSVLLDKEYFNFICKINSFVQEIFIIGLVVRQQYIPCSMQAVFLVTLKHVAQETGCLFDFGKTWCPYHYSESFTVFKAKILSIHIHSAFLSNVLR